MFFNLLLSILFVTSTHACISEGFGGGDDNDPFRNDKKRSFSSFCDDTDPAADTIDSDEDEPTPTTPTSERPTVPPALIHKQSMDLYLENQFTKGGQPGKRRKKNRNNLQRNRTFPAISLDFTDLEPEDEGQ